MKDVPAKRKPFGFNDPRSTRAEPRIPPMPEGIEAICYLCGQQFRSVTAFRRHRPLDVTTIACNNFNRSPEGSKSRSPWQD